MHDDCKKPCACGSSTCVVCCAGNDETAREVFKAYQDNTKVAHDRVIHLVEDKGDRRVQNALLNRDKDDLTAANTKLASDNVKLTADNTALEAERDALKNDLKLINDPTRHYPMMAIAGLWGAAVLAESIVLYIVRHRIPYTLDLWFFVVAVTTSLAVGLWLGMRTGNWALGLILSPILTFMMLFMLKMMAIELALHGY